MARRITEKALEAEIARLRGLGLSELRAVWEKHFGVAVPRTLRRNILIRSIIWQIQAKALGGLKPATRKYLSEVAEAARSSTPVRAMPPMRIRPGTTLVRVWQKRMHTVTVIDGGFEWRGKRYRSLSAIARAITGTRWNGLVFFGVKPSERKHLAGPNKPMPSEMADA